MAVLAKARSLSTSGAVRPAQHVFRQRGTQPVAALMSARRTYWTSRFPKSKDPAEYSYLKTSPGRVLPRYAKNRDGLQYSYIDGLYRGRLQPARSSSNWAPDNRHDEDKKSKGKSHCEESPWEIQRRAVRERMHRRLEAHLSMLRKDPYWGLFGSSEDRGVWNPWHRAQETLQRRKGEAWEESSEPIRPSNSESQEPAPSRQVDPFESDYIYDPISNKRVRRPRPDAVINKLPTSKQAISEQGTPRSQVVDIPVKKHQPVESEIHTNRDETSAISVSDGAKLAGFARQPWLLSEGFLDFNASRHVRAPKGSAWAKSRKDNQEQKFNAAVKRKAEADANALRGQTLHRQRQISTSRPTDLAGSLPAHHSSSAPAKLRTSLYRSLRSGSELRYDESLDSRENLDQLRPDAIRAAVAKPLARPVAVFPKDPKQRRALLELVAKDMYDGREERLNREFAANKWNLKRNLSAYPGDVPKTPEDLRARRQLLEKSFATSTDVIELHLAKALDPSKPASRVTQPTPSASTIVPKPELVKTLESTSTDLVGVLEARLRAGEDMGRDNSEKQKAQQRELVREIRNIYESTYGVVDTKHRQQSSIEAKPTTKSVQATPADGSNSLTRTVKEPTARPNVPREEMSSNEQDVYASNAAGTRIQKPQNMLPNVKPGTQYYPFDNAREPESSSQLLEASVKDFERLMAGSTKRSSPQSTSSPDRLMPETEAEMNFLTAELAEIAADAPDFSKQREDANKPQSYVLLSFNKQAGKLQVTKTTSSIPEHGANNRTVHSILSRLDNPGKYFEHMSKLEQAGYELVAGGRKMLIYRDIKSQDSKLPFEAEEGFEGVFEAQPERGWGVPEDTTSKIIASQGKNPDRISDKMANSVRRSVRRVEETFSGIPPRYESERIAEEISKSQKRRSGPVWRLWRGVLIVGTLFYSFGVTLEWLKDNERRKLIEQYSQEVKRVQEIERKKAQDQPKGFGWGF